MKPVDAPLLSFFRFSRLAVLLVYLTACVILFLIFISDGDRIRRAKHLKLLDLETPQFVGLLTRTNFGRDVTDFPANASNGAPGPSSMAAWGRQTNGYAAGIDFLFETSSNVAPRSVEIYLSVQTTNAPGYSGRIPPANLERQLFLYYVSSVTNLMEERGVSNKAFVSKTRDWKVMFIRNLRVCSINAGSNNFAGYFSMSETFPKIPRGRYLLEVRQRLFVPARDLSRFEVVLLPPVAKEFVVP